MNSLSWTTTHAAAAYLVVLLSLGAQDGLWLGVVAKDVYRRKMGQLMATPPRRLPAALFYLAYPMAVVFFGLLPRHGTTGDAFMRCAALGLVGYGTYNLTNLSVIRGWSPSLSLVDMAWGTLASGTAGALAWQALHSMQNLP